MVDPGGITPLFRALGRSDLKCLFFHFPAFVIACMFSLPFVGFVFAFSFSYTCFEFACLFPFKKKAPANVNYATTI